MFFIQEKGHVSGKVYAYREYMDTIDMSNKSLHIRYVQYVGLISSEILGNIDFHFLKHLSFSV
jgi:hypothetical protein